MLLGVDRKMKGLSGGKNIKECIIYLVSKVQTINKSSQTEKTMFFIFPSQYGCLARTISRTMLFLHKGNSL